MTYRQAENDYTNFVASYIECANDSAVLSKMSPMDRRFYILKCEDNRSDVEAAYTKARLAAVQAVKDRSPTILPAGSPPSSSGGSNGGATAAR